MSVSTFVNGTESAAHVHVYSSSESASSGPLSTVLDLLNAVDPSRPKKFPTAWTAASHLAEYANTPLSELSITMLTSLAPDFSVWLAERHYSAKSISTWTYHLRKLVDKAEALGCTEGERAIRAAWEPIAEALTKVRLAPRSVPGYAVSKGKVPAEFTDDDLIAWGEWAIRRGRKYRTVRILKGLFRQAIRKAQLEHLLPRLTCTRRFTAYGIPVSQMPQPLQSQVTKLLAWKQAKFALGRPQKTRLRKTSAKLLECVIRRLYGFAVKVGGWSNVATIPDLFCESVVTAYAEWAVNTRQLCRSSLFRLSMIYSAVRHHPDFKNHDYSWFSRLCEALPEDDRAARQARKVRKKVSYEVLRGVPTLIARSNTGKLSPKESCWLIHDQLLIEWFVTLVWRSRNVRECRLGSPESANLFFGPLDPFVHVAKAAWVQDLLNANENAPIWQFYFRKDETKMDREVRGIVPQRLVPLLERYLKEARPNLVSSPDPQTLFLNREGGALDRPLMTDLVAELTFKHTGTRTTPHIIRDIFGYAYLEAHPEDFLTLSKILWHTSLKYTLSIYGADYDESNGVSRLDDWLGSH